MFVLNLGSSLALIALPILIVQRFGFGGELAMTLALRIIPTLLASGMVAWVLSRFDARAIATWAILATGITTLLIPLTSDLTQLNVVSVLNGLASAAAGPALMSLRSGVIPEELAMRGNSVVVLAERVPQVLGPLVAAGAISLASVDVLFVAKAIVTAAAVGLLIGISAAPREPVRRKLSFVSWRASGNVVQDRRLLGYIVTGLFYAAAAGLMRMVLIAMAADSHPEDPAVLGVLLGAMAVGAVLGAFVGLRFPRRWTGRAYVLGNVLEVTAFIGVAMAQSLPVALSLLVLAGVSETIATTAFFADVQIMLSGSQSGSFFALFLPAADGAAIAGTLIAPATIAGGGVLLGAASAAAIVLLPFALFLAAFIWPSPGTAPPAERRELSA
jgi:hypothetical protein